jgi:hypothetical protein
MQAAPNDRTATATADDLLRFATFLAPNMLAHGFVERFLPVTDENYEDVRTMLTAAEDTGFMTIR